MTKRKSTTSSRRPRSETKPKYLDPKDVIAKRESKPPPYRSATGYGSKIPSWYELQLKDKRWRRVYIIQYSNSGTPFIMKGGELLLLGTFDPRK